MAKQRHSWKVGTLLRRTLGVPLLLLVLFVAACTQAPDTTGSIMRNIYAHSNSDFSEQDLARDTALFEWAKELGLTEDLKPEQWAMDNKYGAQTLTVWDQYQDHREAVSQLVRNRIQDGLSIQQVQNFYDSHPEQFKTQDIIDVDLEQWESTKMVVQWSVTIDGTNVRQLQESDDELYSQVLPLDNGDQVTIDRGDGSFTVVRVLNRVSGGNVPFDEVVQGTASMLANQMFENQLSQRTHGTVPSQ